jgi:hypothetical protein
MSNTVQKSRINIRIIYSLFDDTAEYAASELKKYIERMMPDKTEIKTEYVIDINNDFYKDEKVIKLGLSEQLGIDSPEVEDKLFDDLVDIDISDLNGYIAGSNVRSILLGVYKFLTKLGCRWVRHGADGEMIPLKDLNGIGVKLREKAAYRHRGLCIEGAVSYENMLENIEWAPKVGYNSYFIEFITPYTFFDRWYSHKENKYKKSEKIPVETVKSFSKQLEKEIKKRGPHLFTPLYFV